MCGIYGRIGPRNDDLDRKATATLRHRGPDDAGLWVESNGPGGQSLMLGHTRLSIVDLSAAGHQPMESADQRLTLVFNGEIYNFQGLRAELQAMGRQFRSHSDTEVILHLYDAYGDAMLQRLEGMYALALWDNRERRLLLARDPVGIKPLFYHQPAAGQLTFASEIKALLANPQISRQPDVRALAGYLSYLYVPPPATAFAAVQQLLPGHKLVIDDRGQQIERFRQFSVAPKLVFDNVREAADQLEQRLLHVVGEHMVADVPVGAFLSGGIDSGLLVALMARLQRERGGGPLKTFTVGFGSEGQHIDETARAAEIAQQLGVSHRIIRISGDLAETRFSHIIEQFDEPFANPTALMVDVLCQGAREEVTVAVTGDGGDEAFGGYPRYRATRLLAAWRQLPALLRDQLLPALAAQIPEKADGLPLFRHAKRFLRASAGSFAETYRDWLGHYTRAELAGLLTPEALAHLGEGPDGFGPTDLGNTLSSLADLPPDADPLDAACLADLHGFLPDNVLALSDRMSMRHALELRVPLADRRIVDFGLRLPPAMKMTAAALAGSSGKLASKRVLREVASRYLQPSAVRLPKQGFVAPLGTWLGGPLRGLLETATSAETLNKRGLVRADAVARMKAEHLAGRRDHTWHLWALMVMEAWFQGRVDTAG
jgi:asparagine synthase (glutamine-hydrolysing)